MVIYFYLNNNQVVFIILNDGTDQVLSDVNGQSENQTIKKTQGLNTQGN